MTNETTHLPTWTLEELAEGTLSHAEKGLALEHVRQCARCAAEVDAHRALFSALASLPSFEPSPGFAGTVMARVTLPVTAPQAVLRRRWLPKTKRGWMTAGVGALAPILPLMAMLSWVSGQGVNAGSAAGRAWAWFAGAVWSLVVRAAGAFVGSGIWEWLVTTGNDLVGGTRGLSAAAMVFAIAIPLSGWMMVRLLRTPVGMTHAH
ncbi:MAG TPA: hypothetical protein VFJ16_08205 [Longimicrobium sp.]|nr:hypothetical protein [Longimicrobium sp.]